MEEVAKKLDDNIDCLKICATKNGQNIEWFFYRDLTKCDTWFMVFCRACVRLGIKSPDYDDDDVPYSIKLGLLLQKYTQVKVTMISRDEVAILDKGWDNKVMGEPLLGIPGSSKQFPIEDDENG